MREIRPSGSEGGARFKPLFLPLSAGGDARRCSPPVFVLASLPSNLYLRARYL